jgi:hypothetical protein
MQRISSCCVSKRCSGLSSAITNIVYTCHVLYGEWRYIPVACCVHAFGSLRDYQTRRLFRTHLSAVRILLSLNGRQVGRIEGSGDLNIIFSNSLRIQTSLHQYSIITRCWCSALFNYASSSSSNSVISIQYLHKWYMV